MKNFLSKFVSIFSAIMLVAQTFIFSAFLFVPIVQANEMCAVDADVVLLIDTSGSMAEGEAPSNCEWWELEWVGPSKQCVKHQQTGLTEGACLAKPDPPQCWPPEYTPATNSKLTDAKNAANSFLDNLEFQDQSALVSFNTVAVLEKSLSNNHNQTRNAVNALTTGGSTNIGDAISEAILDLNGANGNPQASKTIILLTDGKANKPFGDGFNENQADIDYAQQKAQEAASLNYKIFTIGLGSDSDINETMLQNIANITGATYHHAPNGNDLADIYQEISEEMCEYGSISGCKYNDLDGDGQIEQGEQGLSDWEINLSGGQNGPQSQLTNNDGCYVFAGLQDGEYTVSETGQEGWIQTYPPQGGTHSITIAQHNNVADIDFANYEAPPAPSVNPGDIVINEIMQDPNAVPDTKGEWFEVYNTTGQEIDLTGCEIKDLTVNSHIIASLTVPAHGYAVLAKDGDSNQNGGITPDYVYDNFILGNASDQIILICGGVEIDRVMYDDGATFPDPSGASMILSSPNVDNNIGANWCVSTTLFGAGDLGTPGTQNDICGGLPPQPICGDGNLNQGEECDDGNTIDGDGCSSICEIELPPGSVCGNGIAEQGEECDGTDGVPEHYTCTTQCSLEYVPYCGDQTCNGQETCDTCQNDCGICPCNPELELVNNGGFETPEVTNQALWDIFNSGLTSWVASWMYDNPIHHDGYDRPEVASLELQKDGVVGDPHGGHQLAELDTDWFGPSKAIGAPSAVKIYQDIDTIPGQKYTVTFYFSPRPHTGPDENRVGFDWNNGTFTDIIESAGENNTIWTKHTYTLTATSDTTRIQFSDLGQPSNGLGTYLDDISVRCCLAASPTCGDGSCNGDENCSNCSQDCGSCGGGGGGGGGSSAVYIVACGDHITDLTYEQCDDGNTINGDGCSSICKIEMVAGVSTEEEEGGGVEEQGVEEQGGGGEVLGEATEQLPSTGVNPFPIMAIVLSIGFSAALKIKKLLVN